MNNYEPQESGKTKSIDSDPEPLAFISSSAVLFYGLVNNRAFDFWKDSREDVYEK